MSTPAGILSPVWADTQAASAVSEQALLAALVEVEATWAEVLAEAGECSAATAEILGEVAADLDAAGLEVGQLAAAATGGGNPVIPLVKQLRGVLKQRGAPEAGLHLGATSQDVLDTALALLIQRAAGQILSDAVRVADGLAQVAQTHRKTVCIARSLTQHALPTTFGLRAAAWLDGITQAASRLSAARQQLPIQWGGAVGTQAALTDTFGAAEAAQMTHRLSSKLGLCGAARPWHTQRQPLLEVASALAGLLAALGKAAADVLTLQRPEIGELQEPVAAGRGESSAMPQKQNPVLSTLIRSAALAGPQQLAGLHQAAAAAVDERPDGAWHAEWPQLSELLRLTGGAACRAGELFCELRVFPAAMERNLGLTGEAVLSERLMNRLAESLPGGRAALQQLVARSVTERRSLGELLRAQLADGKVTEAELNSLLEPANYLGRAEEFIDLALHDYSAQRTQWL